MEDENDTRFSTISAESCKIIFTEESECFICRDVELIGSDPLRNFCDCKNLLAHHMCLSTWIQTGCGGKERLQCTICNAKYHIQRRSAWLAVSRQWKTWVVFISASLLMGLVPYGAYSLTTAFDSPPAPVAFKVAAACFGILTEMLLIKCVADHLSHRYQQAEQSSFTLRARGVKETHTNTGWGQQWSDAASCLLCHARHPQ